MKRILKAAMVIAASWYFLANNPNGSALQVGPFQTQAACENYRSQVSNLSLESLACFDSKAKS